MKTTIILLIITAASIAAYLTWRAAPGNHFIIRCKAAVEQQLTSPAGATYGRIDRAVPGLGYDLDRRGYMRIQTFQIWLATVDAPNAFGTPLRNYVMCAEDHDFPFTIAVTPNINQLPRR